MLRKSPLRPKRRRDPVKPEVRSMVILRDGTCILYRLDLAHICRDKWGEQHNPHDLERLTIEHVKDQPRMGKRAPSDPGHLVAMCWQGNVGVPSKTQRAAIRAYLESRAA